MRGALAVVVDILFAAVIYLVTAAAMVFGYFASLVRKLPFRGKPRYAGLVLAQDEGPGRHSGTANSNPKQRAKK